MDNQYASADAAAGRRPDILDALLPVGTPRLPDSLPGAPAPRPYLGAARAAATAPPSPYSRLEVPMSETNRRPLAITAAPEDTREAAAPQPAAETLLTPVPLAPLAEASPARGRARVPRMREPDGMKVDLLGVWHAKDRQAPLPAVIWEELTAAHPELFGEDGDAAPPRAA